MYEFVTGPLALFSFLVFILGVAFHIVGYIKGLDWKLDRVAYTRQAASGARGAMRSIFFWIFPYGTRSWRNNPFFTFFVFVFHAGILIIPVFLQAHNILLEEKLGFSFFTISDSLAYILTIGVVISALFLVIRRAALEHVRVISSVYDYVLIAVSAAPFITGLLAYHQVSGYRFWLISHIISGEIMLIAIPFTKLSHFVLFFLSRAQIGMDFGIKRGGMKKDMPW
jgi:nitrate reductase gamma subunit